MVFLHHLGPTNDERAVGFFFSNYVIEVNGAVGAEGTDEVLHACTKSLGLAGLSSAAHAPELLVDAKKYYITAIRSTNAALTSSTNAKEDSTLLAILLLSIFETVTGCRPRSLEAWSNHIKGAAALLNLRGPEQMVTWEGRRLFLQVTSTLVTACLQQCVELPDHILELRAQGAKYVEPTDIGWRFHEVLMLFTNFRAQVRNGTMTDNESILSRALVLDAMLQNIFTDVPPGWEYKTVYTNADPDIVFSGHYYVFGHYMAAQTWNGMWSIRILLNEIIHHALHEALSCKSSSLELMSPTELLQTTVNKLYDAQTNILATVPQHLGYTAGKIGSSRSTSCESTAYKFPWSNFGTFIHNPSIPSVSKSSRLPLIRLFGGYQLPWSLYMAGAMDIATDPVRRHVIATLRNIGRSMGIQQAFVLASVLNEKLNKASA